MSEAVHKNLSNNRGEPSFNRWSVPSLVSETRDFAALGAQEQEQALQQLFDSAQEQGNQQGYQQGFAEGLQNARQEVETLLSSLQSYKAQLEQPLAYIDSAIVKAIAKLVINLAETVVRAEVKSSPDLVLQQLDEALNTLSDSAADISVRMHPEDVQAIAQFMDEETRYAQLNFVEDFSVERGDCTLVTSNSLVESKINEKFQQLAEQLQVLIENTGSNSASGSVEVEDG